MPSPFPGMDPWLEAPGVFPDFHNRFLSNLSEALNALLPPPFYTAIATRVYMEGSERNVEPDVDVLLPSDSSIDFAWGNGRAAIAVTDLLELPKLALLDEETTETYLEIRTASDRERLITSIEMLSPSNKTRGKTGRALYLAKQHEMTSSGVNLVEIDFLRNGVHSTAAPLKELRSRAGRIDYHVSVTSPFYEDSTYVAPIRLPQPLPIIPIPITEEAQAIPADLQSILTRTYDVALYTRRIRYPEPCDPPLTPEQQAWAEGILRDKGILK